MKKALLLLIFFCGSVSFLSAQEFELTITKDSIQYIKLNTTDTVHLYKKITVFLTLRNDGAFPKNSLGQFQQDTFPGGIYNFNFFREKKFAFVHQEALSPLPYGASERISDTFTVTEAALFRPDTVNIIIVWPGGGKALQGSDSLDPNPLNSNNSCNIYVLQDETAGIPNISQNNSFKIYPNPAKDVVNIQLNETGTGMIRLMDMTGKLLTSMSYSAKAGENISLPLNDRVGIPDGLYLIGIENSNGSQVGKIMICR